MVAFVGMQPGDTIDVRFTKWGGGRHWEFRATLLGHDEHGTWAGAATGTRLARPGNDIRSQHDWVTLFPDGLPWAASFYDSPLQACSVYVDVSTAPEWTGSGVTMVDLDLDVVLDRDGVLFIDDEDEFDEHRLALDYPDEVVELARRTASELMAAVGGGLEPFASIGHDRLKTFSAGT
jgi:hypothetical protein